MRVILGVVLVLAGLSTIRSVWGGEASASPEPPLLGLGALMIGLGVGVALRSRAAHLLTQVAAGLGILVFVWHAGERFRWRDHVIRVAAVVRNASDEQFHLAGKKIAAPARVAMTAI